MANISVIGAGTWGIALARILSNAGHNITVWSAIPSEIDELALTHKHKNLPGAILGDDIKYTKSIEEACLSSEYLIFAVPSPFVRSTARLAKPYITNQIIIDVAKGIEQNTYFTMSEIIKDEIGDKEVVALSGPTHAEEVSLDIPTTIVAATPNLEVGNKVASLFNDTCMRVYTNPDIKGVEICGALKNIIALSAGISDGMGYGDNTKAALITRGMAEMRRLGSKLGCLPETFSGLAGIGDLIVTCTSKHSRNNQCGNLIGQGYTVEDAVKKVGMVVEGLNALPAAIALADKYQVEMPLTQGINAIVHGANAQETVKMLLARPNKNELH